MLVYPQCWYSVYPQCVGISLMLVYPQCYYILNVIIPSMFVYPQC